LFVFLWYQKPFLGILKKNIIPFKLVFLQIRLFFIYICNRLRKSKALKYNKKKFLDFFYIRKKLEKSQEIYNFVCGFYGTNLFLLVLK
jgi:hypothetical protein